MDKKMTVEDLLNMEGSKVPTDAKSYSMLVYSAPKQGKTSFVHELYGEKVVMLATERRHSHLPNVHVINIDSYPEYLKVMKLLKDDRLKEKYSAICIDTVGRMEDYIRTYVLSKLGIDDLSDLPYGAAYGEYNKELENALKLIEHSGYVPIFIAHSKTEVKKVLLEKASDSEKDIDGAQIVKDKSDGKQYVEYNKQVPDVREKFYNMINRIVDNVLFLDSSVDSNGKEQRHIFYRDTPHHVAGASFKHMPEYTELSAKAYEDAMEKAIKSIDDDSLVNEQREQSKGTQYDYNALMTEVAELGKKLQQDGKADERNKVIENVLGKGRKVKDLDESQSEVLSVLVDELKEIS
ncbi:hypothetical protein [Staphylococcus phage PT94]